MLVCTRRVVSATFFSVLFLLYPFSAASAQTLLQMESDVGDYIGQGESYEYTSADATFTPFVYEGGDSVRIWVNAGGSDYWNVRFDAPGLDGVLVPGVYEGAIRTPFNGELAGLSVSGQGRGCNQLSGSFEILAISFSENGDLEMLAATFVQHCEHATPALRGSIFFNYEEETGGTCEEELASLLEENAALQAQVSELQDEVGNLQQQIESLQQTLGYYIQLIFYLIDLLLASK